MSCTWSPSRRLNGVYRKLQPNRREEIAPHTRFRIGRHVLEFRLADAPTEVAPRRSSDGEVFQSRRLVPLGFLDLIGPDGRSYLSFPLTKRDERGTRIGRAGVECDIALTGDEWVSLRHAAHRAQRRQVLARGPREHQRNIPDRQRPDPTASRQREASGDRR